MALLFTFTLTSLDRYYSPGFLVLGRVRVQGGPLKNTSLSAGEFHNRGRPGITTSTMVVCTGQISVANGNWESLPMNQERQRH